MTAIIDIHTHVVPERFPIGPKHAAEHWPCMNRNRHGGCLMTVGGRPFRELDARVWDVGERRAAMALEGTDIHVLSPMPELLSHWLDADDAVPLLRHVNETIAHMVKEAPASFVGLGAVPMQSPDKAVDELDVIKFDLGLSGIEVGASINERPLGDPMFRPVLARAQELQLAVFVHSVRPSLSAVWEPHTLFAPTVGYPTDVAMAAMSLLLNDVMRELPELRIAFAHGGGALITILPRLAVAWERSQSFRERVRFPPIETASRFFYDSLLYEPHLLMALVELVGASRICIGSDEPFAIRQPRPAEFVCGLPLSETDKTSILHHNARRFLALDS